MPHSERRRRLAWLIVGRALTCALLLGSGVLIQVTSPGTLPIGPFVLLVALCFALTALYALGLPRTDRWLWQADAQLAVDAFLVSGFVVVSGGVVSYLSPLYVLPIMAASSLLRRRGALAVAILSSSLYGLIVLAQYEGGGALVRPFATLAVALPPPRVALYTVGINVFAFLALAGLSGSLAERLRHAGARLERASTEIAHLQAFHEDVIESLTSGLVTTDIAGRILSFNRAAAEITGQSAEAVIGRDVATVLHLPDEFRTALAEDLGGARSRRADFLYPTAAGGAIEIGMAAAHLVTPGGRTGFLITFQDITEMKRLAREARVRQRLAAVGEMAAGLAHEIRNPLASMAGSIQVLREELSLNSDQAQLMDIVLTESKRLNTTIKDFLAFARPQRTAIERLDLRKTIGDTAMLLRNSSDVLPGHTVLVDTPEEPVWYEADEGQIRQVVWNLASNGLRAMPSGGQLRLAVGLEPDGQPPGGAGAPGAAPGVLLEVQDEGVGIAAEDLDGIFQPFHGTFVGGSGLGLAVVHRIVSDYHGEIQVTSAVGKGTTVRVRLGVGS